MKMMKLLTLALFCAMFSTGAWADDRLRANTSVNELTDVAGASVSDGDFMFFYDLSAGDWSKTSLEGFSEVVGVMNGVTATTAELNYNDITTLGTLAASKTWTSDASLDTVMPSGGLLTVQSGGAVTFDAGSTLTLAGKVLIPHEDVTATNVLTAAECGKTMTLNSATEFVSTLPAPAQGCSFRFTIKAAPSGASYTVVTNSTANIMYGGPSVADVTAGSAGPFGTGNDTWTFVDSAAVIGDTVNMWSDGTNWYVDGSIKLQSGGTFTNAD